MPITKPHNPTPWWAHIVNLLLYGNFWIAICALCMVWQTNLILRHPLQFDTLPAFVFFSTLFLYAIHRIVGLKKVASFTDQGRYRVIYRFRRHIFIYACIGLTGSTFYFFQLPIPVIGGLLLPALLSLGYVLPVSSSKRLRDFHYIKIFLIALVWAWVTVGLPFLLTGASLDISFGLLFFERACFIFAITIPFDIRDVAVDADTNVKTLPMLLGVQKSIQLGYAILLVAKLLSIGNYLLGIYSSGMLAGMLLSFLITLFVLKLSIIPRHDYFFTGLVDGLMGLQFLWVFLGSQF